MKQLGSISKEKLISLEEGLATPEARMFTQGARPASNSKPCKQIVQCVKIILYLLFAGLAGYAFWQTFSINMMEFKVISSIRETQSEGLFGQRESLDDKRERNAAGDIVSTTVSSDLDGETSYTNETDDDESIKIPDVIRENYGIYEANNEEAAGTTASTDEGITLTRTTTVTTTTESPVESVESNSSLAQQINERFHDNYDNHDNYDDYLASGEMKLERDQEEILDNYALLSLIIQNALRTSQVIDSFVHHDTRDRVSAALNWGDSAALSSKSGNVVEEESSQGTQETLKSFVNEGDYEDENLEYSDYQTETGSTARDYYGQFYRRYYDPWKMYV